MSNRKKPAEPVDLCPLGLGPRTRNFTFDEGVAIGRWMDEIRRTRELTPPDQYTPVAECTPVPEALPVPRPDAPLTDAEIGRRVARRLFQHTTLDHLIEWVSKPHWREVTPDGYIHANDVERRIEELCDSVALEEEAGNLADPILGIAGNFAPDFLQLGLYLAGLKREAVESFDDWDDVDIIK